jgi:DNA-binding GntR family transcriptional regulator
MREADLAEWLGISRTPTRDALRQLEAEGLLEAATRRGLVVATLDQQRVSEIYDVRSVLESLAARLAARQATQAEIGLLKENLRRQEELDSSEVDPLLQLNSQFHAAVYRASRNRYLIAALQTLETPLALLRGTTYADSKRPAEALEQHRALVDAIENGDADLAHEIAADHVRAAERIRLVRLAEDDEARV